MRRMNLPQEIFKAYDIRGIVGKTLTPEIVRAVGQALGSRALERGRDTFRDRPRRASSPVRTSPQRSPTACARPAPT
jgi:phosphomannomutase